MHFHQNFKKYRRKNFLNGNDNKHNVNKISSPAMSEQIYNIIIIGGGPIGLACGLEAKKAGLTYLIIEKGTLVNSLYNYPVNMTFFSTSERLEIGGIPFVSNNAKPTRNEGLEYYRRVAISGGLHVKLFEEVVDVKKANEHFTVTTSKQQYTAANIIV